MTMPLIVVGVDVGGTRKGFHAVALRDGQYLKQFAACDATVVADWCRTVGACCIGIDAPCCWNVQAGLRPAERELRADKIPCFCTPTRQRAVEHPTNYYGWMLQGEALYAALQPTHPLISTVEYSPRLPACFETFPQAIACKLAGHHVSGRPREKRAVRQGLLARVGVEIAQLQCIDPIDAALCAYTAHRVACGRFRAIGAPSTGYIMIPEQPLEM